MTAQSGTWHAPNQADLDWVGWERTDGWASLAAFVAGAIRSEELQLALSYRLSTPCNEERRTWGSAFVPLTVSGGHAWPPPVPLVPDIVVVTWARWLKQHLPPPVEARLLDLQLHHGRRGRSSPSVDQLVDAYVATWESPWSDAARVAALARALELTAQLSHERASQVRKCAYEAWEEFCDDAQSRPSTTLQEAWVGLIEAVQTVAFMQSDSTGPRVFLRSCPDRASLVRDAWCKLGLATASNRRAREFLSQRSRLWAELAARTRDGEPEAQSDLTSLAARDPHFAVAVMTTA